MILVLFTSFSTPISREAWDVYMSRLPEKGREKILRFRRWQDRHTSLLGRLLLRDGLIRLGYDISVLARVRETFYGRPYLEEKIDFNLSHSGRIVACALTQTGRVGIDVEEIRDIDFESFERYMSSDEWNAILQSQEPAAAFFRFWTRKESLIKADGRGLSIPLETLCTISPVVEFDGVRWHLTDLTIDKDYPCCLAASRETDEIELVRMEYG